MTRQESIIRALAGRGFIEVQSKSRKYRTLHKPGADNFYFVGKAGAVRVGKTVTDSISLTSSWGDKLVSEGQTKSANP